MQGEAVFFLLFGFISLSFSAPREGLPLLNPGGIGGIFEGPDSETIIQGPDGSEITSEQKGGAVIRDDGLANNPIIVAEPELSYAADPILTEERVVSAVPIALPTSAPILDDVAISAGPILASSPPTLLTGEVYNPNIITENVGTPLEIQAAPIIEAKPIEIIEQDPHLIETEIIEAPGVESDLSADLKGASGRIITKGSASIVSGPASTTITEPRKIIVAPPKISIGTPAIASAAIPLNELPELPVVAAEQERIAVNTAVPISSPSAISYDVSSTLAPPALSYSTTSTPLVDVSSIGPAESLRIDLGANDLRESIPVVEYGSLKGVISGAALGNVGSYSSSEAPIGSSSLAAINAGIPSTYGIEESHNFVLDMTPSASQLYVQKIPRIDDIPALDGRLDMGYSSERKNYQIPQVLGMALSEFYRKTPLENKNSVIIDDKMGDLSQNEIVYDRRQQSLLDTNHAVRSQANYDSLVLSQEARWPINAYQTGYDEGRRSY